MTFYFASFFCVVLPSFDFTPFVDVVRRSNKHSHNEVNSWHACYFSRGECLIFQSIIGTFDYLCNEGTGRTTSWTRVQGRWSGTSGSARSFELHRVLHQPTGCTSAPTAVSGVPDFNQLFSGRCRRRVRQSIYVTLVLSIGRTVL